VVGGLRWFLLGDLEALAGRSPRLPALQGPCHSGRNGQPCRCTRREVRWSELSITDATDEPAVG
jgi:hypothetical protein